jgi:hypothetical protein
MVGLLALRERGIIALRTIAGSTRRCCKLSGNFPDGPHDRSEDRAARVDRPPAAGGGERPGQESTGDRPKTLGMDAAEVEDLSRC